MKKTKERPSGITTIAVLWIIPSIITINQGWQTLSFDLPYLPYLPDLFDPSAPEWFDLSVGAREWISFGLPAGIVLNFSIVALGFLTLFVVYGLFTAKSWSYKPTFAIPVFNAIVYGATAALYASAPYELFFDLEFALYSALALVNLVWLIIILVYLRKLHVRQFIVGSPPPLPLPISALHVGTGKGDVIKAIVSHGRPSTWREISDTTGLDEKSLNRTLYELISSEEIYKVDGKYNVSQKLYSDYAEFSNQLRTELISWINQWKKIRKLDFSLEHEHFFLEGRHLDDFSKELISHAKSEVLVVNPFIQDCDLSNTLRDARKHGITVQIITRPPRDDKYPEQLKKKQEYHSKLKQDDISLIYKTRIHAKLLVVDRIVAIVSSMNFYPDSSAGVSWEAGLVSTNQNVVESIIRSALSRLT